eukprot:gene6372-biopygen7981
MANPSTETATGDGQNLGPEIDIEKEIAKLNYYTEQTDELIEIGDTVEMEIATNRVKVIHNKIIDLTGRIEEMKLEQGESSRSVRQWKKDVKDKYTGMLEQNEKMLRALTQIETQTREEGLRREFERKQIEQLREDKRMLERQKQLADDEEKIRRERYLQEKSLWEERMHAEIKLAEKKLEMECGAKATFSKLPELRVTPFKGTIADWIRFENMFTSQVLSKGFSDEVKFGYLLEMVNPRVRDKIANLKPGKVGLETAWERLKKEYGQRNAVINTHIDEIVNLPTIKGVNYEKIQEFYDKLTKNYDALLTLDEENMLRGFVMTTLNKLPNVKSDLVRLDDDWESWGMSKLIDNLQKWLKRNKTEEIGKPVEKREKHWYTGFTPSVEETLPPILPLRIDGKVIWAFLDTGSGRNFISKDALMMLKSKPERYETKDVTTINGTARKAMPIFQMTIESLDKKAREHIEVAGVEMHDFTTVKRPDLRKLKQQFRHTKDKEFYITASGEHKIHMIIGDKTYSKLRTETVFKGNDDEPIVEGTSFGWIIHGGEFSSTNCMFTRELGNEYERLYSLDILGVEDRGEDDQLDVYKEFKENISRQNDGRYEVNVPWIPGSNLAETNEMQSRKRLKNVERKLRHDEKLQKEYTEIVENQLREGVVERVPSEPSGTRIFYMPHKPVVRESAATTKVRMVFDASARPTPTTNSINDCMYKGPVLQPNIWDIMVRARMTPYLLLGDIQKAFLQIGIKSEDRDAFRFLFTLSGKEEHLRFLRVPFGGEASPFMLGGTLQHHYEEFTNTELASTLEMLRENTYVDNLMCTGMSIEELQRFKGEASEILEDAKFQIHKWESNIESLESENMENPSKILGHVWNKEEDTLMIPINKGEEDKVSKNTVLSQLARIYDPLGIISPTLVEGKRIFREACDENKGGDAEVSEPLMKDYLRWMRQLRELKIPRTLIREIRAVDAVNLHIFADASEKACCAVTIAVVEQGSSKVKGLLTSKSRISKRNTSIARLELVGGQMAANMAKNICKALKNWPITSINVWMDSMVALFWINNPGKQWKAFVANRVRKITEIGNEIGIEWKYRPSSENLADLGSRGANIEKMVEKKWFEGPDWLLNEEEWPEQPVLKSSKRNLEEQRPIKEAILFTNETESDEWDKLLERQSYWRTLRTTSWCLRFIKNCLAKKRKEKVTRGPLTTEEIMSARDHWVVREQRYIIEMKETPGWKLIRDEKTGMLRCQGRIQGYQPIYLEKSLFTEKLIRHTHRKVMHMGVANTMGALRETWWIPKMRTLVKREIRNCNVCKVFSAKPFEAPATAALPMFRTVQSLPFQNTGVDFAGPLK